MFSLWLFKFLFLLIACSVEGSSYCMADRHDNSHQLSLYLKICCHPSNRGKSLKIQDEMAHKSYILCPSVLPTSCPAFNTSCSQLHEVYTLLLPQVIIILYYLIAVRLKCTVIWRVLTVMEMGAGQE